MTLMRHVAITLLTGVFLVAWGEDVSPSTKQALEQLHLLQQRLAAANQPQSGLPSPQRGLPLAPTSVVSSPVMMASPPAPAVVSSTVKETPPSLRQPVLAPAASTSPSSESMPTSSDKAMINQLAFAGVTQQLFPLKPKQIVKLHRLYDENEQAKESPVGTPPKPTATSQFVNLSTGSTPPVIRLSQGFVSSLVFLDSTGAPWPILAYDLGDPASFDIKWDKISNTLMIQPTKLYTYGNLAVRLRDLNTPVMLTLIPGQKAVDYRVDLRVQGFGPNAQSLPMEEGLPPSASDVLLHVLDGVPPTGSTRLKVSGGDARAWLVHEKMFVRTNLTILSPGWLGSMTSADGMHAYEMHKSPVLLVAWHGQVMQLKVEGL